jgi:cytochrome P450
MTKLTFGEPLGFIRHGSDFNGMIRSQKDIFRYISVTNNWPILDSLLKKNPVLKLFRKKPNMFFNFAQGRVKDRIAKSDVESADVKDKTKSHPDLLSSFIAARCNYPDVMTDLRITHYCQTNVVAGANNSALAMDQTIAFLARHPEAQEQLYEEMMAIKSEDGAEDTARNVEGPPALELALKMQYLDAVIQESYRLFASPSNNLERVVSPGGLTLPSGVALPPGAVAAMNGPSIMHRQDIYGDNVNKFDPERWLQGKGEDDEQFKLRRSKMDRSLLAFGAGSRVCIGRNLVQLELFKIWPVLIQNYRFQPVGEVKLHEVLVKVTRRE